MRRGREVVRTRRAVLDTWEAAAVHDLRVATRRLQTALDLFEEILPRGPCHRLLRRARRIRRTLGAIRNARVMRDLVRDLERRTTGAERALVKRLGRVLEVDTGAAFADATLTQRAGLPKIRRRLRAVLDELDPAAQVPLRRLIRDRLSTRAADVVAACVRARYGGTEAMHGARLAVKRYRYTMEILREAGRAGLAARIQEARALQEELGAVHDLDLLIGALRRVRLPGDDGSLRVLLQDKRREHRARAQSLMAGFLKPRGVEIPRNMAVKVPGRPRPATKTPRRPEPRARVPGRSGLRAWIAP